MQKFQVVFAYEKTIDGKDETVYDQTWCKNPLDAIGRVRVKLPQGAKLKEAWFCEWQNPDAPIEPLWNQEPQSRPDAELVLMVAMRRADKIEGVLAKAKKVATKSLKAEKKEAVVLSVKPAKKPFRPFVLFAACSWRDWAAENKE